MSSLPPHIASIIFILVQLLIVTIMSSAVTAKLILTIIRHQRNGPITSMNYALGYHCRATGGAHATKELAFALKPSNCQVRGSMVFKRRRLPPQIRHSCQQNYLSHQTLPSSINSKPHNTNRYDRFRHCLLSMSKETLDSQTPALENTIPHSFRRQSLNEKSLVEVGKRAMEVLSSNRRSFNRTWKRMSPLIELIVLACNRDDIGNDIKNVEKSRISSIADIGCDHGILSLSLACMAWVVSQQENTNKENQPDGNRTFHFFSHVIGADLSRTALENGGLVSLEKMKDAMIPRIRADDNYDATVSTSESSLPIEFRVGFGLEPLQTGEADAIVLAGMGVHTMLEILLRTSSGDMPETAPVECVQTQQVFLQPTNSRPQHMIILYDKIQASGWVLRDERIAFVGGRWYICAFFERCSENSRLEAEDSCHFPGHFLAQKVADDDDAYDTYVQHHLHWLKQDYDQPKCLLADEDRRWLNYIVSSDENWRWKSLASWFLE